jgi:hypothetical protein
MINIYKMEYQYVYINKKVIYYETISHTLKILKNIFKSFENKIKLLEIFLLEKIELNKN